MTYARATRYSVSNRNSRVRIEQETKGTLRASIQYWDFRHGSVLTANWRGHKPRMRIEGRNRSEAFAPKTLDEVVRIAEPLFIHFSVPSWGISRDRPTNYRGRGRPRHTFRGEIRRNLRL